MTSPNGAFASERAEYLSVLGLTTDPTQLTLAQLKALAAENTQDRSSNPVLFDSQSGQARGDVSAVETGSLSVGNSVAATTLGAVSAKVQIFDLNGNPLGFLPVYASIT